MSPAFAGGKTRENNLDRYWGKYEVSKGSGSGGLGRKWDGPRKPWGIGEMSRMTARMAKPRVLEAGMTRSMASAPERIEAVNRLVKQAARRVSWAQQEPAWKLHSGFRQLQRHAISQRMKTTIVGTSMVTSLDKAVESLARLTANDDQLSDGELRMHSARLLRRAAVDQSRLAPRVGSIALLLSDVLLNSPTLEASGERRGALRLGLDLLMDSFVGEERERELYRVLMDADWEVTAPFDSGEFADLIDQAEK